MAGTDVGHAATHTAHGLAARDRGVVALRPYRPRRVRCVLFHGNQKTRIRSPCTAIRWKRQSVY
eukprot:3083782-Rhodomonas_salina.1